MLMAALALAGLTGMYLRQVTKIGVLGLLGYVLFAAGYLCMLGTEFVAAFVLPTHRSQCTRLRQRRHRRGQQWHRDR